MEPSDPPKPEPIKSVFTPTPASGKAKKILTWVVIAEVVAAIAFRLLVYKELHQSAAVFIGIPALLALILIQTPDAKSTLGLVFKTLTLALLMAGPVFQEGYICLLFSAPLFYAIAALIVVIHNYLKKKRAPKVFSIVFLYVPFLALSLEGTIPEWTIRAGRSVVAEQVIAFTPEQIMAQLAKSANFDAPLPKLLDIGFPRPLGSQGSGIAVGDTRVVHFSPGEGRPAGDLLLKIVAATPDSLRFQAVSDSSHINHWLKWQESEVRLTPMPGGKTKIAWTVEYKRLLNPSWYFNPIEDFFVTRAADYLITALAIPRD